MGTAYTCAIWRTMPGRSAEFMARWSQLASWAMDEFPGRQPPVLLRNIEEPDSFVSFGAWESQEEIDLFRNHPEFKRHIDDLHDLLESFTPAAMEAVVE
jgi:heme-degrading monooxygenase HmoA